MKRISSDLLDALLQRLLVTKQGIELVKKIRDSEPLEPKPRVRAGGTRGVHVTPLMGFAVRLNHSTLQSALLHELDHPASGCIEYYSWSFDIGGVRYSVSDGTRSQVDVFRPFLFEMDKEWCGFVDVFPTSMLKKSVASGSALYEEVSEGCWTSPPIVESLSPYGLQYKILTEAYFGKWYLLNMGLLSPYHQPDYKVQQPDVCEAVVALVTAKGYMFRRELIDRQLISPEDLNYLIATRRLFFPIRLQDLTDMRTAAVFRDATAYETFKAEKEACEGFFSLNVPDANCSAEGVANSEPSFLRFVSPEAYVYAQRKLSTLSERTSFWWPGSGRSREGRLIPLATKAAWKAEAELGELTYNSAVYGLVPRWNDRGSRAQKYPESELLWDAVYLKHRLLKRWTIRATHGMFVAIARRLRLPFFSERTAKVRDSKCDRSIFVKLRDGSSARYSIAGFAPPGTANRLYQATVPFLVAHIDHTPLSIRIENSANGRLIKSQVWLTVMIDCATGRKLAWVLSFSAPSAASVATVLFECIDRHKCLPRFIIVDNAPEFDSLVMHRIFQEAESHLIWRPPYHPRYGSPVEAANNQITTQVLQQLTGNTVAVKNLYDYSRTFIARNPELMTLTQLNAHLKGVFDEVELKMGSARTGDESVLDYEARREMEVGVGHRKVIELTLSLRRLCMPEASNNGLRRVRAEGYIVVNNLAYYSEDLKRFQGQNVRVFPDVIHPGLVYVFLGKDVGWYTGKSIFVDFFSLYSRRELLGVIAELRLGRLRGVRNPVVIAQALAELLIERERDPARKDEFAKLMDRLMNRAPSLLATEPDSHNYFNPPPKFGSSEVAREASDAMVRKNADEPHSAQSESSTETASVGKAKSSADRDTDGSDNVPPVAPETDADFDIVVRPTRLSF